jgi:hypothetical protein
MPRHDAEIFSGYEINSVFCRFNKTLFTFIKFCKKQVQLIRWIRTSIGFFNPNAFGVRGIANQFKSQK